MKFISYVLASLILFLNSASAQNSADKKAELTYKFLNQKQTSDLNFQDNLTDLQATSEKSSGLAMIMVIFTSIEWTLENILSQVKQHHGLALQGSTFLVMR
jgi:hypothetical protein